MLDTGVRTPSPNSSPVPPIVEPVPFNILLEPLYFGVLPESVIPILLFLVPLVLICAFVVTPMANSYFSGVVKEINKELVMRRGGKERKSE